MKANKVLLALAVLLVILTICVNTSFSAAGMFIDVYSDFSLGEYPIVDRQDEPLAPSVEYWKSCSAKGSEICFGDYYRLLSKNTYPNRTIVPDTIVLHTDNQSGNTPQTWYSTKTYNGLSGRQVSVHFGVGLDGITQFLPMYPESVVQCRGAGWIYDCHSIQIEMSGRTYNYLLEGKATPEMEESIIYITERTLDLVVALMITYDIPIENVMGHYQVNTSGKADPENQCVETRYSGKTDPGNLWLEEYFLPMLEERLEQESS